MKITSKIKNDLTKDVARFWKIFSQRKTIRLLTVSTDFNLYDTTLLITYTEISNLVISNWMERSKST